MGANNFATCPRCLEEKIQQLHGKISKKEYLKFAEEIEESELLEETLAEYSEIGINNGIFFVSYSGSCKKCGFKYTFEKEKKIIPLKIKN